MARFTISERVAAERVAATLPPDYRERLVAVPLSPGPYTVVLFPHDRRDVVTSAPVRRALARIPSGLPVVAAGGNFTVEALAALDERRATVIRLGEFHWTDTDYHAASG